MLAESTAFITLIGFAAVMLLITVFSKDKSKTTEGFLLANRQLGWKRGAASIAVSWIWAPAIFVASLQSYLNGLAGAFWFIFPNILCFFLFIPLIKKLRNASPKSHTLAEYIAEKFSGKLPHLSFLSVHILIQIFAIIANATAGGFLINLLTGIEFSVALVLMSVTALAYSLINGFKASILTDLVQISLIILIAFILVPWILMEAGGFAAITKGLGGIDRDKFNIFNSDVLASFGLGATLTLLFFPISDQMFIQRAMAVKPNNLNKTFIAGGLLFGLVPIILSIPGFIAAGIQLEVSDPQMVAPLLIVNYLPQWSLILFTVMAISGLCSTIDSALCAISALCTVDVYKKYINKTATDQQSLRASRYFMLGAAMLATGIALLKLDIVWSFLISGTIVSAAFIPTVFALYSKSVSGKSLSLSIIITLLITIPLAFYANLNQINWLSGYTALIAAIISYLVIIVLSPFKQSG